MNAGSDQSVWTVWRCPTCGRIYTHDAPCDHADHYNTPAATEKITVERCQPAEKRKCPRCAITRLYRRDDVPGSVCQICEVELGLTKP